MKFLENRLAFHGIDFDSLFNFNLLICLKTIIGNEKTKPKKENCKRI